MRTSNILATDSYKLTHYLQLPPDARHISAYAEPRGGAFDNCVHIGPQAWILQYLTDPITKGDVDEAEDMAMDHVGYFNRAGWDHILRKHGGMLPLRIQSLPEGIVVPTRTATLQIRNTDPVVPWLTTYVETPALRAQWYPSTVASLSFAVKLTLRKYLEDSEASMEGLDFMLHNFGARGSTSGNAAGIGDLGHQLSFMGTDNVEGLKAARDFYGATDMTAFSVMASEHTTTIVWGKNRELEFYTNLIQYCREGKIVSIVIDSYNPWNVIDNMFGGPLRELVVNSGGKTVVRPDSGEPTEVLPKVVDKLMDIFGFTYNGHGLRVLPPYIGAIQGDGVTIETIPNILDALIKAGISPENVVFGMGAGLMQKVDRDTMRWAMKANEIEDSRGVRAISKNPSTDRSKASRAGRQAVIESAGEYMTIPETDLKPGMQNLLRDVYVDGEVLVQDDFASMRARTAAHFEKIYGARHGST